MATMGVITRSIGRIVAGIRENGGIYEAWKTWACYHHTALALGLSIWMTGKTSHNSEWQGQSIVLSS